MISVLQFRFVRWLHLIMGIVFLGIALRSGEWSPALFGGLFLLQFFLPSRCASGQCAVPTRSASK